MSPEPLNSTWLARLRRNLLRWYAQHARTLPWRIGHDPYHIWISEIMLQQTTVAAVIPYYERFLEQFPTVADLAAADEQEVLRLWEGLGYYSRARNIHKTAGLLMAEWGGNFPETTDQLRQLPGIGRYTAGAIASFAFDARAPIVEANTLRLYSRLLGFTGDPRSKAGQDLLWDFAARVLPRTKPGRMNQALMELGATCCAIRNPACVECPLRTCCSAFANGTQAVIPRPRARPAVTRLTDANVVVRKNRRVLLRQCSDEERWSGLWDFPRYSIDGQASGDAHPSEQLKLTLQRQLRDQTGIEAEVDEPLAELHHSVTRYRIRLLCFSARFVTGRIRRGTQLKWVTPGQLAELPLSMTARKIAQVVSAGQQN